MRRPGLGRAILAGVAAWVVFVVALRVLPLFETPKLNLPDMLGGLFGLNSAAAGWVILFAAGIAFALLYAYWWLPRLPGPGWQRGLIYGFVPWLVMLVIVAPLLPVLSPAMEPRSAPGFFFANLGAIAILESLVAFQIWGTVLGGLYASVAESRVNVSVATLALVPFLVFAVLVVAQKRYSPIVIEQDMSGIVTYDPARVSEPSALPVIYNVYDRLVAHEGGDPTRVVSDLAQSWTVSKDGLEYVFELRHGVRFSSHIELSADDVMWSYRRLKNLKDRPAQLADAIADVRAIEHYIVRIRLTRRFDGFLGSLASPQFAVLDGRTVLAHGGIASPDAATNDKATPWLDTHSAGTGPWVLESYAPSRQAVLVRNPYYWGGAVYPGSVIFRHVKDGDARWNDLKSGRADIALGLTNSEIAEARQADQFLLLTSSSLTVPVRDTVRGVVPADTLELRSATKE